jgi:outer membrane autotransporter protein
VLASLIGGYDFRTAGFVLSPELGFQYTHLSKDSYTETGAGAFDLNVGQQDVDSLRSKLGLRIAHPFTCESVKFTPEVHASWYHEFLDDTSSATTSLEGAPDFGSFVVRTTPRGNDFALVGAGLSATPASWHENVSFFLNYDAQVGQTDFIAQTVDGGVRVDF